MDCVRDSFIKGTTLEIANSLNSLQVLSKVITMSVYFTETGKEYPIKSNSFLVTPELQNEGCPTNTQPCEIEFKYTAGATRVSFQTIIQKVDGVLNIYDGVSQKVETTLSQNKAKYFKYWIRDRQTLHIMIESSSSYVFQIGAKVINTREVSETGDNFPGYTKDTGAVWVMRTKAGEPLSVLSIPLTALNQYI